MKIHAATKSMTEFTCGETRSNYRDNKDLKATALNDWGHTAVAKRSNKHQHWWPWAQGWIARKDDSKIGGLCERDEWPPAYFWPGDDYAKKNNMGKCITKMLLLFIFGTTKLTLVLSPLHSPASSHEPPETQRRCWRNLQGILRHQRCHGHAKEEGGPSHS